MTPARIIARKRDGHELAAGEIADFLHGFARGSIPDYQMAALAMAIFLRGMTTDETAALTDAMLASGVRMEWPDDGRLVVDKHSSGGIGDKTSLILAPLLAACGMRVPMISGRGLGPTGGTLDKLESIPGFRTDLSLDEIHDTVGRVGCVITGASAEIAPADRKLYALRDVTATVPSIPLITASIMSKKLAESLDALVLDVKFGSGAFMKHIDVARKLARSLVETGKRMGVRTTALLTDMNQPLGRMAGNLVEVHESLACLRGEGPQDLWECTRALAAELLPQKCGPTVPVGQAQQQDAALPNMSDGDHRTTFLDDAIISGRALAKFAEMVAAQGGDLDRLPPMPVGTNVVADKSGFVAAIDAEALGHEIIEIGGGRKVMTDRIDHAVGLEMLVRLGDEVAASQPLVRLFGPTDKVHPVQDHLASAIHIGGVPPPAHPLIAERIE
jgi:pyrimidine-nucleoside phosphorylase